MDSYLSIRRIGARGNIDAAAHAAGGQLVTAQHQEGRLAIEHTRARFVNYLLRKRQGRGAMLRIAAQRRLDRCRDFGASPET